MPEVQCSVRLVDAAQRSVCAGAALARQHRTALPAIIIRLAHR